MANIEIRIMMLIKNYAITFAGLIFLASCASTGSDIKATSEVKRGPLGNINQLMIVRPEQNRKDILNHQAYAVAVELQQQLNHAGIPVSEYTVKGYEINNLSKLMEASQRHKPSHILSITLESGKVAAAKYLQNYTVDIWIRPATESSAVWHYRAEVYAPTSSNQEVAAHVIKQMQADHLIE